MKPCASTAHAGLQGAGHLLRAAAAAGARTAGAARGGGAGPCAAAGAGVREGRVGSEERHVPARRGVSLHVTKFGLTMVVASSQLEFTSMGFPRHFCC